MQRKQNNQMKRFKTKLMMLAVVVTLAAALSSCINNNYLVFEDDEWSGSDFNGENMLLNGELEIDDYDR